MNLTSSQQVKRLLAERGLRPKRRLGQNFLTDRNTLEKIIQASGAGPGVDVIEIGPGLGVVTLDLARTGARVVCVEADRDLEPALRESLADYPEVEIVIGDFLRLDLPAFLSERSERPWTVVANLPYYITTPIIASLIEAGSAVSRAVLMVQSEVADRLRAAPGTDSYGSLSVFVQYHCVVESVARVSRNVFYPAPEVDSEVVSLTMREKPAVIVDDHALFGGIVRAAFGKRRKTLLNALSASELGWDKTRALRVLVAAGIDPERRGETLSLEEFARLAQNARI